MFGSRFLWKLYAGYAVVIVLTAFMVGVMVVRGFERDLTRQIQSSLHSEALLLRDIARPYVDAPPDSAFQHRVWTLGSRADTRMTVIDADGRVLADSREDPSAMDNQRTRPEIVGALTKGVGVARLFSSSLGGTAYVRGGTGHEGRRRGRIRAYSRDRSRRSKRGAVRYVGWCYSARRSRWCSRS